MLACPGASQSRIACSLVYMVGIGGIDSGLFLVCCCGVSCCFQSCVARRNEMGLLQTHTWQPHDLQEQGCAYRCITGCLQSLEGPEPSGASADAAGDQAEGALPKLRSR